MTNSIYITMIKNIIFDFGDVFINLNKSKFENNINENFGGLTKNKPLTELFNTYEKGLISSEEFITRILHKFPKLNRNEFVNTWNSIIADFPFYRVEFLKQIQKSNRFKLFLLSNTNDLHIDYIKTNIPFYEEFKSCFDKFYLSQEINLRKPDKSIFEYVLRTNKINAEETLFIDDTLDHIKTAQSLGIKTWFLKPNEDVTSLLTYKKELFC